MTYDCPDIGSGASEDARDKPSKTKKGRVEWIDTAKGIAIVLVVVGHDLRGLMAAGLLPRAGATEIIDGWIYAFHMPLFFLLAGFFVPHTFVDEQDLKSFLTRKLSTVVYPYFLWSLLTILLKSLLGQVPNTPRNLSDVPKILYWPVEQYWFLYALFIIFLLYGLTRWLAIPTWLIMVASATFSVFHLSTGWVILNVAFIEAIYFSAGVLIAKPVMENSKRLGSGAFILLGLAGALVPLFVKTQPFAALGGICFSIVLAHLLCNQTRGLLEVFGKYSLQIFLAHSIVSSAMRVTLFHAGITEPSVHILVGCVAGILIPCILSIIALRQFPYLFTFPRSR